VDVRALSYVPKPQESAYDTLIKIGSFEPAKAALFDDSVRNLVPAHVRGMTTIWFNNGGGQSHWRVEEQPLHIDHETDDLARFLSGIRIDAP
jgi:putative hydrolase of the HAD superfamily